MNIYYATVHYLDENDDVFSRDYVYFDDDDLEFEGNIIGISLTVDGRTYEWDTIEDID